ncbi:MAG: LCP family protein [Thermomicrobiales bacterium]|nr:LCP family protein [Thermomicrobiales bacterium]
MYSPPPQSMQRSSRRRHWSTRKRIALVLVMLMVMAPFVAAGYYIWDITRAIEGVQNDAVVDLPTSNYQLGGVSQSTPVSTTSSGTPITEIATQGPQPTSASSSNPGSFKIAQDLLGTGTGADTVDPSEAWPGKSFINVLVLGVDRREDGGDQNADVIMIARLDLTNKSVRVVSIPRDLEVEVPGYGKSKINGAYNLGVKDNPNNAIAGVIAMRDTIEYNFGINIDEFVMIDFEGFESVIDAVGGITINVPERIEDDEYPTEDYGTTTLVIEAGVQHMNGKTALAYARTRHQDSDDQRRERQMDVLLALLDKAQSLGSVTRISQVISAVGDAVLTSFDWDEQLALIGVGLNLNQNTIVMESVTEPLVTPGTSEDGAWIYIGDPVEIGNFIESVLDGSYSGE